MKKALLLALAGLFAAVAPALAYPPALPANVNFSSERGVPFGLVLDGRPLTRGVARQVHVDRLVPGQHWADFSVPTAYGGAVRLRSRVWLQPGVETTFVLIARPGRPLYLQQVNAVALYGPNYGGYGNGYNGPNPGPGRYNSPTPYGQGPNQGNNYPPNGGQNSGGYDNQGPRYDNGAPNNGGGYGNNPNGQNGPAGGYNNSPNGNNNSDDNSGYYPGSATSSYRTLPPQDVDDIVQAVQQRPFDSSRLSMAKEALAQSSIQADDLKRLLLAFSFEPSRVELAKFAYSHVADRQNFYRVYQSFNSEASKREVEQAVASSPQN